MEPNNKQIQTAKLLNLKVRSRESYRTLKARIIDHIADAIGEKPLDLPTEKQCDFAKSLGIEFKKISKRELSAKIEDELEKRNMEALNKLEIKPGSIVQVANKYGSKDFVVSSIKENGKIYFKGHGCPQAWASKIDKVIKSYRDRK